ncbi:MAG TPA: family 43 glycosylhydrolase [Polyangiaceae bacterium]|nr:family 43 glycosylhydrolase [Polyangiaceae bacterium]
MGLSAACSSDGDRASSGPGAGSTGALAGSAGRAATGAGAGGRASSSGAANGGSDAGSGTAGHTAGATSSGGAGAMNGGGGGTSADGGSGSGGRGGSETVGGARGSMGGRSGGASGQSGTGTTAGSGGVAGGSAGAAGSGAGQSGAAGAASCTPPAVGTQGQNPLFTDQYTADPAPFVDGCTFYIHCGHDEGSTGFVMKEWFVLKSTDMVHWTKTVGMKLSVFSWADANSWAGQLVKKGSKYYWYVPVNQRGAGMAIGVAVGDGPEGPFTDAIGHALVDDASEMKNWSFDDPGQTPFTIDPTVFIDGDGQAYLHYGGFGRLVQAKLGADMISIDGKLAEQPLQGFFEAPFLTQHAGNYYEIYAAGSNPATIDYAVSTSPLGPWSRKGRILDALPGVAGQDAPTNHSGVAELAGQWYIVYHVSNGPNGGGTYKREVAVEKLTFNADGTIAKVTPSGGLTF